MKRPKEKNTINRHEEEHQKKVRQPMHHLKRSLLACLLTLMLTTLLTAGVAQAAGLTSATWSIVPSPNGAGSRHNELLGVAAVSSTNIWAVGYSHGSSGPVKTLIEHWNGTSWRVVFSPNPGSSVNLHGVAAISARNIWAVGGRDSSSGLGQTLIEHWNGTSWQIIPSPNAGSGYNDLFGVAVVSANDIWAVGVYATTTSSRRPPTKTLTEFYG